MNGRYALLAETKHGKIQNSKTSRNVHITDDNMEMGTRLFEQGQLENGLWQQN